MPIIHLDDSNFASVIREQDILVDFFATWCGPCATLGKVLDGLSDEGLTIGKVDIDKSPELAKSYGVRSVPTLIYFSQGQARSTSVGVKTKKAILDMVRQ